LFFSFDYLQFPPASYPCFLVHSCIITLQNIYLGGMIPFRYILVCKKPVILSCFLCINYPHNNLSIYKPVSRYQIKSLPTWLKPVLGSFKMATFQEPAQDEDSAELTFPKEFENAETLLISEVSERPFCFSRFRTWIRIRSPLNKRFGFRSGSLTHLVFFRRRCGTDIFHV
jgi:hypothetical protein